MTPTAPSLDYVFLRTSREASTSLHLLGSTPEEFVTTLTYDAVGWDFSENGNTDVPLGTVNAKRVLLGAALNAGVPWYSVMDSDSQGLASVHAVMFDSGNQFNGDFEAAIRTDCVGADLLYIVADDVLAEQWGPLALQILAQHHGDCEFLVVELRGLAEQADAESRSKSEQSAKVLLEMGYEHYPNSPYFFLNRSYVLKPLSAGLTPFYSQKQAVKPH
jgi:hypothetical protein